jgi:hypothetical protein
MENFFSPHKHTDGRTDGKRNFKVGFIIIILSECSVQCAVCCAVAHVMAVHSSGDGMSVCVRMAAVKVSRWFWRVLVCSAVQCSAVQCSAVQCSAVQCSAVQCRLHTTDYLWRIPCVKCASHLNGGGRQEAAQVAINRFVSFSFSF